MDVTNPSKQKGTVMETAVVNYLRGVFSDTEHTIRRGALHGRQDEGDVHGLTHRGGRIVVEVKNRRRLEINDWLEQAERERGNADAAYGVVVFHRNGIGLSRMGEQGVLMTLETFARLIGGDTDER